MDPGVLIVSIRKINKKNGGITMINKNSRRFSKLERDGILKLRFAEEHLAQNQADRFNDIEEPYEFCPLINRTCVKTCTCFVPFQVTYTVAPVTRSKMWKLWGFCCDNRMLHKDD